MLLVSYKRHLLYIKKKNYLQYLALPYLQYTIITYYNQQWFR